ncbi:sigma-70 family RNA polymerase sigma factor [Pseudomonas putida]
MQTSSTPGCQQAVGELYRDHHHWLFAWLRAKLGCAHNAADVAHDTFARILMSRDLINSIREPRAYLSTTARRLLIDSARRKQIEAAYLRELALTAEVLEGFQSPEQTWIIIQTLEAIAFVLEGLAEKPRQAFLLYYLEGSNQAQIAQALGVSERMVRKYLVQALAHCDQSLDV